MSEPFIRYAHGEGADAPVVTITIDRAEKRNAMTYAMLADFTAQVARASEYDHREGVASFLERRPASFTGR